MLGFSSSMIECRLGKDHHLVKVWHLLDWNCFAAILKDVYARGHRWAEWFPMIRWRCFAR